MKIGYQEEPQFKIGDIGKIYRTLAKNLYKHPLNSAIIEIISNARDTMNKVGKCNDPIFLHYNDGKIHIRDEGEGMSPEFMSNHYIDIGWSSKGNDPNAIGQFGIGKLSPLAYTSSYEVITRYEGIESKYFISDNEEGVPDFDLVYSVPTEKINGTEVIFQIKKNYGEVFEVEKIIKQKLPFFHNLIVTGLNVPQEYKIYEYTHFKNVNTITGMCILHGNCLYPLDYSVVSSKYKSYPVCLSFDITDPINPTPDRSGLQWSRETIKLVQDKINLAEKEIEDLYFEQNKTDNIIQYLYKGKTLVIGESTISYGLPSIPINIGRISKKTHNLININNIFTVQNLFPIRRFGYQSKHESIFYNLHKSYLVDKKDLNKYKNYFTQDNFITLPDLDDKFETWILDRIEKGLKDDATLRVDFIEFKNQLVEYIKQNSLDASVLVFDKVKKKAKRVSRKGEFYGKVKYRPYRWFSLDRNRKISIYTTNENEFYRLPSMFSYLELFLVKPSQVAKLKEAGFLSLEEMFSSKRYEKAYNRMKLRNDLIINQDLIPYFKNYNKDLKRRVVSIPDGNGNFYIPNPKDLSFLEKYQKNYYYEKIKQNITDNINPNLIEYDSVYHYLYLKLKKKNNVQSKIN